MRTLIVTDDESFGVRLRSALQNKGQICPPECVVRHSAAGVILASSPKPALVVVDVGRDEGTATSVVSRLRPAVGGRLVAVGELGTARAALHVRRAGADEYIEVADALSELTVIVNGPGAGGEVRGRSGRTLAVLSPSGGGGASTLAANLAVALAAGVEQDVALLDLVPATGCLADLFDLKPVHTLADLCDEPDRLDRDILERTLVRHESAVSLLASPRSYEARGRVTAEAVERIIDLARGRFPFVVLDLDRELGPAAVQAARCADLVLITLRQEFTSLRDARLAISHLQAQGVAPQRISPIAMRRGQPRELPAAKVEAALQMKLAGVIPDDPKYVLRAANNGVPLVIETRSSRAARAITELSRQLRARVESGAEVR